MTIGLPRSGKSTWAKEAAKLNGCPIVNPDSIRKTIYGQPWHQDGEPMVWAIAETMVRSLFYAGHDLLILDATNLTDERRKMWYRSSKWLAYYKYIDTSMELCKKRAKATNMPQLVPIIERMAFSYEEAESSALLNIDDEDWFIRDESHHQP